MKHKSIYAHKEVVIYGLENIKIVEGEIKIGLQFVGFTHKRDITFINIRGKVIFEGDYSIGRGCRIDIGPNATMKLGKNGYVTANTNFIIMHGLIIGDNCSISWNCQFLDEDFHEIEYLDKRARMEAIIEIGNHVWIGCNTFIYKGVKIPNGCVVASNSVVKTAFNEENTLIAGNPARIVRNNIQWT